MPFNLAHASRAWIALLITLLIGAIVVVVRKPAATAPVRARDASAPRRVACLGRIEPEDGVIVLSARSLMGQPSIVAELRVREGDRVSAGQVIAILNSHDQLQAAWREAESRVLLARKQLAQVEAGAKKGDLAAQQAEVARLEAELANADVEWRRFNGLYADRLVTQSDLDLRRTRLESARQMVQQARQRLDSLAEVRQTDLDAARAAVAAAEASAERAHAEFEPSTIRSPVAGLVLKIRAWPGEEIGSNGIVELGKTEKMYVIAEVPESDLAGLKLGDPARVTGDSLPAPLDGVVEQIGYKVDQSRITITNPAAYVDSRVVQVKIRLREASRAERLIHAQVSVLTNP